MFSVAMANKGHYWGLIPPPGSKRASVHWERIERADLYAVESISGLVCYLRYDYQV